MKNFSKYERYEINEADIDKAIHILTVFNQRTATPEEAIDFLIWLRTGVHEGAKNKTTEELIELYNQTAVKKKTKEL